MTKFTTNKRKEKKILLCQKARKLSVKESFPKVKEPTGRSGYWPKFKIIRLANITMSITVPNILNIDIF